MIGVGDKVVCVDDVCPGLLPHHIPGGMIHKGEIYVIAGFSINGPLMQHPRALSVLIIGKPNMFLGENVGWRIVRFRKLEDYRNEQELAYRRTQPAQEPQHA